MNARHNAVDFDFGGRKRPLDYTCVPEGTYLCRIAEARHGLTRNGHPRWGLKFVVHEGPEAGRLAAWDGLTFSPEAAARTQLVLKALGLPHQGRVRIEQTDLVGRLAFVEVESGIYRPENKEPVRRNKVPYGGVHPADRGSAADEGDTGEVETLVADTARQSTLFTDEASTS